MQSSRRAHPTCPVGGLRVVPFAFSQIAFARKRRREHGARTPPGEHWARRSRPLPLSSTLTARRQRKRMTSKHHPTRTGDLPRTGNSSAGHNRDGLIDRPSRRVLFTSFGNQLEVTGEKGLKTGSDLWKQAGWDEVAGGFSPKEEPSSPCFSDGLMFIKDS